MKNLSNVLLFLRNNRRKLAHNNLAVNSFCCTFPCLIVLNYGRKSFHQDGRMILKFYNHQHVFYTHQHVLSALSFNEVESAV